MLGLSDSGVSRAVARLEARLGVDRSLRLTGEGGRFYAEDATSSRTRRLRYQRPPGGAWPLGVEIDPFFSRLVLALRLGDLLERCPDLSLELVTTEAPGDLFAHGFDVGVRFGEATGIGLIARKLLDTGILTVASPAYLQRHDRPEHPGDVATHKCIQYRDPRPFDPKRPPTATFAT
ncbi:MAG: LysR family transcriptional regulator [Acetobacteraceae bacterium]|jgi:DNA-binding transcriptional LysR family regulator